MLTVEEYIAEYPASKHVDSEKIKRAIYAVEKSYISRWLGRDVFLKLNVSPRPAGVWYEKIYNGTDNFLGLIKISALLTDAFLIYINATETRYRAVNKRTDYGLSVDLQQAYQESSRERKLAKNECSELLTIILPSMLDEQGDTEHLFDNIILPKTVGNELQLMGEFWI